jgi:O-antigen/teichoic acid export membrane protein
VADQPVDDVEACARRAAEAAFPPVSRRTATLINLAYTYISIGLTIVRGLVLAWLYVKYIDQRLLGVWFALSDVLIWIMMSEGGAWLLLRQQTAQEFGRGDRRALAEAIGAGALLLLILGVLIACVSIVLAPLAPGWFDCTGNEARTVSIAFAINGVALALCLPAGIPRAVQQGLQRQLGVNVVMLIAEIGSIGATIMFLYWDWGVLGIALGVLTRELFHNLLVWPLLIGSLRTLRVRPRLDGRRLRATVPLMGWTFLSNIGAALRGSVDSFVIAKLVSPELVVATQYSKRFWDLATSVLTRISNAFTPAMAHLHGEGDLTRFRSIADRLLVLVSLATAIVLAGGWALNEPFMRVWLPKPLHIGHRFDVLCGTAMLLTVVGFIAGDMIFAAGNIRASSIVGIAQTIVRVVLLVVLVLAARGMELSESATALALPISTIAACVLGGGWYLLRQWVRTLGLTSTEVASQAVVLLTGTVAAGVIAYVSAWIPPPVSWGALLVHAAGIAAATTLMVCAASPATRRNVTPLFAAVAQRISGRGRAVNA